MKISLLPNVSSKVRVGGVDGEPGGQWREEGDEHGPEQGRGNDEETDLLNNWTVKIWSTKLLDQR